MSLTAPERETIITLNDEGSACPDGGAEEELRESSAALDNPRSGVACWGNTVGG
jgi:hypothetical protein